MSTITSDPPTQLDLSKIDEHFPHPSFRPGQREYLIKVIEAFNKGKRFVILEAPTGSGKSAIGVGVANFFDQSYYLTIQKMLQSQITRDFHDQRLVDLKGRANYPCTFWDLHAPKYVAKGGMKQSTVDTAKALDPSCNDGYCRKKKGTYQCDPCMPPKTFTLPSGETKTTGSLKILPPDMLYSSCPYFEQVELATRAHITCMNFSSFLYQSKVRSAFAPRDLLLIDECHNTEKELLSFISMTLNDVTLRSYGITIPNYTEPEEYYEYFNKVQLDDKILEIMRIAKKEENIKLLDEYERLLHKYRMFNKAMMNPDDEWVAEFENKGKHNSLTLKPVFIDRLADKTLLKYGKRTLLMSATILDVDVFCGSLGIERSQVAALRMKNRFPVKNRPIFIKPAAKVVGGKAKENEWGPKLVKAVDAICKTHKDHRGIIHTHNFSIANLLLSGCKHKSRFLFQHNFYNKEKMLEYHATQTDSIILAPAMHEGLDLKDDLSRFQIICKVPWPNPYTDKQLARRIEIDHRYYEWLTALKLVQSCGRSVRSDTDWAITYIIDEGIVRFLKSAQKMIPDWLHDAVEHI